MDISRLSDKQLLKLHADIEGQLRKLNIISSSNNPAGDLAEPSFARRSVRTGRINRRRITTPKGRRMDCSTRLNAVESSAMAPKAPDSCPRSGASNKHNISMYSQ